MWIDSIQGVYGYLPYLITLSSDLSGDLSSHSSPLHISSARVCAHSALARSRVSAIPGKGSQNGEGGVSAALLRTAVLAALLSSRRGGGDALSSDSKKAKNILAISLSLSETRSFSPLSLSLSSPLVITAMTPAAREARCLASGVECECSQSLPQTARQGLHCTQRLETSARECASARVAPTAHWHALE